MSRVVEAARRVAQGHLDERLPTDRRDEIGELNRSFNEMVDGLREKAELEGRLHQAERLSAIAHLASGIAHEVRNPLNSISLIIDHLRAQFSPESPSARGEFTRLTAIIKDEIHRLNNMIGAFLKYGKPLELTRQPTDIRKLLDEVLEVAATKAQDQQIRVERDYAPDLPEVWVDGPHIKTCFLNLVLNALQAMRPSGGTLAVSVRLADDDGGQFMDLSTGPLVQTKDPAQAHPLTNRPMGHSKRDGWVEIRFQDTGMGIAPEHLPRVFEPYFTTKEVGIGLGLALTKQILEEHGGRIELVSQPGKGTVAQLRLPTGAPEA
jgi:signal transduction histidine kinase